MPVPWIWPGSKRFYISGNRIRKLINLKSEEYGVGLPKYIQMEQLVVQWSSWDD